MHFEYIFGILWLLYLKILGEINVEFGQFAIRYNRIGFLIKIRYKYLLSSGIERKLFLNQFIGTLIEYLLDLIMVVKFYCHSEGDCVLRKF